MEENNSGAEAPKRPTFITVLCILTWVGCGIGIVMSVLAFVAAKAASGMVGMANDMAAAAGEGMTAEGSAAVAAMNSGMTNVYISLAGGLIGSVLCLLGSLQMWKLKKMGFYVYVAGQVIAMAIPFIFPVMAGMGGMGVVGMIFPIVFIVLYGINLKHMH